MSVRNGTASHQPTRLAPYRAAASCLRLRVVNGPEAGRRIQISHFPALLGRSDDAAVRLRDPEDPPGVSRLHCRIEAAGAGFYLVDSSTNGTAVNGCWLASGDRVLLLEGARLQLGPCLELSVEFPAPPQPDPSPAAPAAIARRSRWSRRPETLLDELTSPRLLAQAWERVRLRGGAFGPDGRSVADFAPGADRSLSALRRDLRAGRFRPASPRTISIPGRKPRPISIFNIECRIVHHAVRMVLEPLLDPLMAPCSFAYRPGRGAHHALRAIEAQLNAGCSWVARSDVQAYFERIPHQALIRSLATQVKDEALLHLIGELLSAATLSPGTGIPQGSPLSPLLSNWYLTSFDHAMLEESRFLVRYGDDFAILAGSRAGAEGALAAAEAYLRSHLQLSLNPARTTVRSREQGFTFLGFDFGPAGRRPSTESTERLQERIRHSTPQDAERVKRGWSAYYQTPGPLPPGSADAGDDDPARLMARLLQGREDCFARQTAHQSRIKFTPCAGALDAGLIRRHLAGDCSVALYLQRISGAARLLVLDLDVIDPAGPDGAADSDQDRLVGDAALRLRDLLAAAGATSLLETSGRRGRHLWIAFSEEVDPQAAGRLARLAASQCGLPAAGLRLEVFPRHTEWPGFSLGDAVRLPLGLHPLTGRRSYLLDQQGRPASTPAFPKRTPVLVSPRPSSSGLEKSGVRRSPMPTHAWRSSTILPRQCRDCSTGSRTGGSVTIPARPSAWPSPGLPEPPWAHRRA